MSLPIRFEKVTDDLYRSGRPAPGDYAELGTIISTLVNLEGAEQASEELVNMSFGTAQLWFPIDSEQIILSGVPRPLFDRLIDEVTLSLRRPVLVHCHHGQDRTGAVIAAIRMRVMGWSYDEAMKEALSFGYRQAINRGLDSLLESYKK